MNEAIDYLLTQLIRKNIIGAKHTPEDKLIKRVTRCLSKKQAKEFKKEYQALLTDKLLLRSRKATGKGMDWHICINPRKQKEIMELMKWEPTVKYTEIR